MRYLGRSVLALALSFALVELPALDAAASKPLGVIINVESGEVDGTAAVRGADLFPGDTLATESQGMLQARAASGQVYLLSATSVALSQDAKTTVATLARGTAGFACAAACDIELSTPVAAVRAKSAAGTHAQVRLVSQKEIVVSAYRGDLELESQGQTYTVAAGQVYRVLLNVSPAPPGASPAPPVLPRRISALEIIVIGAVSAYLIALLIHEVTESPSKTDFPLF